MLCVTAGTEVGGERHGVVRRRGRPVRETRLPGRTRGGKPKLYIQKSRGGYFGSLINTCILLWILELKFESTENIKLICTRGEVFGAE